MNKELKESMERLKYATRYPYHEWVCEEDVAAEDIRAVLTAITELQNALLPFTKLVERASYSFGVITQGDIKRACALLDVKPTCHICDDTGWNHGVQCKPNKAHPTGWKTEKCDCTRPEGESK